VIQDDQIVVVKDVFLIKEDRLLSKKVDVAPGNPPISTILSTYRRRVARE
jgi:hypothetical protein